MVLIYDAMTTEGVQAHHLYKHSNGLRTQIRLR